MSKKPWEIIVSKEVEPDIRKNLKRILRPELSVGRPRNCLLCGTDTTWTINGQPVCPACHVKYGFISADRVPDLCEVCGRQGEWCTDGDPVHSLCWRHRDAWFHWSMPELGLFNKKIAPEKWHQVWEEGFARFVAAIKEAEK